MSASSEQLRRWPVRVEAATPEALAPFGRIIGRYPGLPAVPVDYYGGSVILSRPVDYECRSGTELSLASINRRPLQVRYLERHFQHTQAFIPLGGKPFMVVLAPPSPADLPDPREVRAFRFDGSAGLCLHIGTWHEFPFALEDGTDIVVVLSRQTTGDLQQRAENGIEAFGPDLDKKDMTLRLGTVFELQP